MPPPGGFPSDLSELNLSGWAALVQDVVAGLQAVPPNLSHDVGLPAMVLLQLLEATLEWASATFAAIQAPGASAWEPTSGLPPRHGAR